MALVGTSPAIAVPSSGSNTFVGVQLTTTGGQLFSSNNTDYTVTWSAATVDTNGYYSGGHIVIPTAKDGKYLVGAHVRVSNANLGLNGNFWDARISISGTAWRYSRFREYTTATAMAELDMPFPASVFALTAGQTIDIIVHTPNSYPSGLTPGISTITAYETFLFAQLLPGV